MDRSYLQNLSFIFDACQPSTYGRLCQNNSMITPLFQRSLFTRRLRSIQEGVLLRIAPTKHCHKQAQQFLFFVSCFLNRLCNAMQTPRFLSYPHTPHSSDSFLIFWFHRAPDVCFTFPSEKPWTQTNSFVSIELYVTKRFVNCPSKHRKCMVSFTFHSVPNYTNNSHNEYLDFLRIDNKSNFRIGLLLMVFRCCRCIRFVIVFRFYSDTEWIHHSGSYENALKVILNRVFFFICVFFLPFCLYIIYWSMSVYESILILFDLFDS